MVNFNSEKMVNMVKGYDISWKLVDKKAREKTRIKVRPL